MNKPCAAPRLRPRPPRNPEREAAAPSGPKSRPMIKYPIVDTSSDDPMKWRKMKSRDRRTIAPKDGAYARPHARAVRSKKKESRYVKEGSGRCQVFLVSVKIKRRVIMRLSL